MKKCNICNKQYSNAIPHYCDDCGNNLSNQIEKTDILLFISNFFKIIGIIGIFTVTYPLASCAINPVCIDGSCVGDNYSIMDWIIIILPIILLVLSFILKRLVKNICLSNIKQ